MYQEPSKINPEYIFAQRNFFYDMMTTGTFFHDFSFFFSIFPYGSKSHLSYHKSILLYLLCLNMSSCLILNNIWYVHIRHNSITTFEIFAFFRIFFNFCKNWNFFFAPRKNLMLIIYQILLQNFSFTFVWSNFNRIMI